MPQTAAADENGSIGSSGLTWSFTEADNTLTISGTGDMPDFFGFFDQPWNAFRIQIKTVTIGAGVTSVGQNAFLGCTALKSVTLPAGLKTLGVYAFADCNALTSIELPASLETIGTNAFDADAGGLTEIKVQTGNTHFEAAGGVLYNKGQTALLLYPRKKPGTTFAVPASVTTIEAYAFSKCAALESITLPDALETIGNSAFSECSALKSVTIPKKVETIGDFVFRLCTELKDVTVFWNTPLTIPSGVFAGITPPTGVTLHVPGGTGEAYKGKDVWKEFTIVELPWGDFDNGLHWAYDAATRTLTITNPTPDSPQPMPDFADWDHQPWKACRGEIQKVTIGAGVTSVGAYAFRNCTGLTSVTLPEGLQTIEENVFWECRALTHVTIPKSVTTIGKGAFVNCEKLANVTLPADAQLGTIGERAFSGCERLTSINLPEGLKTIGKDAFAACFALSDLTIPKSVETIEEGVFYQCGSLTNVTLPDDGKLTTIGKKAFFMCRSLTNLTIPKSVNTIGESAFSNCEKLASIELPASLQTLGESAFAECAALASISIPKSVTTIGNEAFSKCTALKDVTVAWETPIQITTGVFNHLTLEEIRLHVPADKIGAYKAKPVWRYFIVMSDRGDLAGGLQWQMDATTHTLTLINPTPGSPQPMPDFANPDDQPWRSFRSEIQAVTIEDGVTSVGKNAFGGCTEMKSVTLPKSVITIRSVAFDGCNKMTHVTLPADAKLDTIGNDAFSRCDALTSISLPKSVTTIEDRAFSNCEALTSVTLPADGKLQTIGMNAFSGCVKLERITIPHSVTTIEVDAFSQCKELTSVTLPDNAQFTKIEGAVFHDCVKLERITIPNHVDTIGANAFNGCTALASVTLPKSVTEIEVGVFQDCTALKDMTVAWTDTASIPNISPYVIQYTPPATVKLSDIRLHVPHGTVAAYQSEDVWKEFTIVEQPLPPTPTPPTPDPTPRPRKPRPGPVPTPQLPDRPSAGTKIGGLTLSATNFTLNGERTFRFTITITPAHAADKRLSVSSSDETVVRVRILPTEETRRGLRAAPDPAVVTIEGTVCGLGKAKIHVKSTDGSGLNATCDVEVRSLPTANIEASTARIYTSEGRLYLSLPTSAAVRIYNVSGTLVRTFTAPVGASSVALPAGVYVVHTGNRAEKVVVD